MHLTGGQFKGRVIINPKGGKIEVKPTLSKVREGVFNVLNSYFTGLDNLSFLDMFAGSGIMSLEAVSRGFSPVCAIEFDTKTFLSTSSLFKTFPVEINFLKGDSLKIIQKLDKFDVIYLDPPWDYEYEEIIQIALRHLTENGVLVVEGDKKKVKNPSQNEGMEILPFKQKIYGRCMISFFRNGD